MTTRTPLSGLALAFASTTALFLSACVGEKPAPLGSSTATTPGSTAAPTATKAGPAGSNQPPSLTEVAVSTLGGVIDNAHPNRADTLEARANASDPDGDGVIVAWVWAVNGQEIPGAASDRLPPEHGRFKKGDTVTATARVRDTRGNEQAAVRSASVVIRNSPPQITSQPATLKSYQVAAADPDGDTLRFYLENKVPGFVLNSDGLLSFDSAAGKAGAGQVLVIVAHDDEGATSKQNVTVNF